MTLLYLDDRNLREVYSRAMPAIVVGNGNGTEVKKRVISLEEENKQLRTELEQVKLKMDNLSAGKQEVLRDLATIFTTDELKKLKDLLRKPSMEVKEIEQETPKEVRR